MLKIVIVYLGKFHGNTQYNRNYRNVSKEHRAQDEKNLIHFMETYTAMKSLQSEGDNIRFFNIFNLCN